jgi:hypothetical protein
MQHKTPLPRSTKRQPTKNNLPTENNQTFQFESDTLNRAPLLFYPKIATMQKQAIHVPASCFMFIAMYNCVILPSVQINSRNSAECFWEIGISPTAHTSAQTSARMA